MPTRTTITRFAGLLGAVWLAAGCSDAAGPASLDQRDRAFSGGPEFSVAGATPMTLDQVNGTTNAVGTAILKGFNPTNPHRGDAVIATFFWVGSTNIITSVGDHLTDGTPVGNTYRLVEYVTQGGLSMATYVATNVQNFPDPNTDAFGNLDQNKVLVVEANLSASISMGGVMLSAYHGVTVAVGPSHSASGSGSDVTPASPGAIPVAAGALVYGVSMSNRVVGVEAPAAPFANVTNMSDPASTLKIDGAWASFGSAGTANPSWTWFFNSPGDWMSTAVALNPVATNLVVVTQPTTTLPFATIPAVRVAVQDDLGNTMTSFTGTVTIAIGRNGGLIVPGTLSGTKTVSVVNGIATFSDLSIDQPGNGYTLRVTASGLAGSESAAFNIGAF